MGHILRSIKRIFFWTYARNTWQWDVLCVVILVFIFLTPKGWFRDNDAQHALTNRNRPISTVLIGPEVVVNQDDRVQFEHRVRILTGRPDAEVVEVRKRTDPEGKILGYEVDIR